jgi:hypothetical protein
MIIWDGTKIDTAGMYEGIPMPNYHGNLCVGPSLSSGGMRTMWERSPAHYYAGSYLNPNRVSNDNPAFAFGRAAHKLLIEGLDGFESEYAIRPDEYPDFRSKAAQQWRADQIERGLTVLTPEDIFHIKGMAQSLGAHPMVKTGILDGMIERSLIWQDEDTGIWIKARPDVIPGDCTDISDLKTTGSVDDDSIQKSMTSFGYHVQAAVACAGVKAVMNIDVESFTLVFAEKLPPYAVRVVTIPTEDIARGASQMKWAIREFAKCLKTGVWPGPGNGAEDAEFMGMSQWARDKIDRRLGILLPAQELEAYEATYSWEIEE